MVLRNFSFFRDCVSFYLHQIPGTKNKRTKPVAHAGTETASVTDESVTPIGDAGVALGGTSNCSSAGFAVSTFTNSSGTLMSSANYTVSGAGVVVNTTALTGDSVTPWIGNYTYTWGSQACTASENMTSEFGNYTSLIGLVGTIIFLGLVIGILVAAFAFGGRREV